MDQKLILRERGADDEVPQLQLKDEWRIFAVSLITTKNYSDILDESPVIAMQVSKNIFN